MEPLLFVLLGFLIGGLNQVLANWYYHRRIKRSMRKFLYHASIKFPNRTITLSAVESSDLEAIENIRRQLEELDESGESDGMPTELSH